MSEELSLRIRRRIAERGPLTFAAYMELALYDPGGGFFARSPVGHTGDFVTSVHVSPVFAALWAAQIEEAARALGGMSGITVVDAGAADGTFLRSLLTHLHEPPVRAIAVERGAQARAAAAGTGLDTAASIDEVEPFRGVLIANELLDNLPFHRLRARGETVVEVFVDTRDGMLVEREGPPTVEAARAGDEWVASPAAEAFIAAAGERLSPGYAFFIDYGYEVGELPEPVRGYESHRRARDLLARPGATDITGPVDFAAIARAAARAGLQVWGPVSQARALRALGYGDAVAALRSRQQALETQARWREAIDVFGARNEAGMLIDPAGLGGLKVLALGSPGLPEPRATRSK